MSIVLNRGIGDYNFPGSHSLKSLWHLGFGAVNVGTLVHFSDTDVEPTLISSTLLANTPQLILSLLYFAYNAIFTCENIGREWSNFGRRRQPLRVTTSHGDQRSTYWLTLPYRYGVPLMIIAVLIHWLFSRSIFLVDIQFTDTSDSTTFTIFRCGWSPSAIILSIIVVGLFVIVSLLFGFRKYAVGPPLVGSCSAAIAAACHREADESADMVFSPLKWGVTSKKEDGVGHCTFSAREVEMPNTVDLYR